MRVPEAMRERSTSSSASLPSSLVLVLGFVEKGGVDSVGLAVFFREISVYGLNVFLLVCFLGLGSFVGSNSFLFHLALDWSPGDRRGGEAFGHATSRRR